MVDNRGKVWLPEHYDQLTRLFAEGTSLREMCLTMGRMPNGVLAKLEQLGLIITIHSSRNFHKVDPDPWSSWQEVTLLGEEIVKVLNGDKPEKCA